MQPTGSRPTAAALRATIAMSVAFTVLAAVPWTQLSAQQPSGTAGVVVGIVVDSTGRALDGASVFIDARKLQVTTGTNGAFRLQGVRGDTVTIAVRRIGYFPQSKRVAVGDGASIMIELVPRMTSLPASVVEATLSGLGGFVSDTAFHALFGAEIQVLGSGQGIVKTDSGGRFFVDVRPGHYMVRVTNAGHVDQMVGVTIPEKGGRQVAVRLTPGADPAHARESWYADGLRDRLIRRLRLWSNVYTREDIRKLGVADVAALATSGAVTRMDSDCMAIVNGGFTQLPLWALDPNELELVEVYTRLPITGTGSITPRGTTSIGGNRSVRTQAGPQRVGGQSRIQSCSATVFVWTSK